MVMTNVITGEKDKLGTTWPSKDFSLAVLADLVGEFIYKNNK